MKRPAGAVACLLGALLAGAPAHGAPPANAPATLAASAATTGDGPLLLELTVNGQRMTQIARAERRGDALLLAAEAWASAGLLPREPVLALEDGSPAYRLSDIPGVRVRFVAETLSLEVDAPPAAFTGSRLSAAGVTTGLPVLAQPGVMLNYDAALQHSTGAADSRGVQLEAVAFGPWGHLVHSTLVTAHAPARSTQRLDTFWRMDMPGRTEALIVGDTISAGGAWSRPVRFGGLRWGRDFSLRPGFVTRPALVLAGEAALPSTVDVLVSNGQRLRLPVTPGPFDIRNLTPVTGAGEVNLVVRDLLGRETVTQQSFYASPQLLAPGLTDFSFEAGAMRRGWGLESRYDTPFAAFTWREGLNARLTGEVRVEAQRDRLAAGLDLAGLLGAWAALGGSLALSQGSPQQGSERGRQLRLVLERHALRGGFSLQLLRASRGFSPFGEDKDPRQVELRPRSQWLAAWSGPLAPRLSAGVTYARQTRWSGETLATLGVSAAMPLGEGASMGAFAQRQVSGASAGGWSVSVNFNMSLGSGAHSSAQADWRAGQPRARMSATQSPPAGAGTGWRVEASNNPLSAARADLQLQTEQLAGSVDVATSNRGDVSARLGLRGTVGWLSGHAFASRAVGSGSLALVEVEGLSGVAVMRSHQKVATTDASGRALLAGLVPWSQNRIEVDLSDLPLDVEIGEPVREVRPYARSGMLLRFPVRRTRSALVVLHQADGSPVPAGATVRTVPQGAEHVVGMRGEAWLVDVTPLDQRLEVRWPASSCHVRLPQLAGDDPAPTLGPLACRPTDESP